MAYKENIIEVILSWIAGCIRRVPLFSVWVAASLLSIIWTFLWLITFFFTTWFFDLETPAFVFIFVFWISIAVESVIMFGENTFFVTMLSKPLEREPSPDNIGFNFVWALLLFSIIFLAMFFYNAILESTDAKDLALRFSGQDGKTTEDSFWSMLSEWWLVATSSDVLFPLLLGTIFRAIIYK